MKTIVLIPCYNEEITIKDTILSLKNSLPNTQIVVCDNNSTDNTLRVALDYGAKVITEKKQGKGFAMQTLFNYANREKFNIAVMIDGDNTYSVDNIQEAIDKINQGYDMVIGVREQYFKENKKFINGFGNKLIMFITNIFSKDIIDPLSGYRVFSKKFIENYPCDVSGFEIEMDMNLWAVKNNMKISTIKVDYRDRPKGSYSKINWKDGVKILWKIKDYIL